MKYQPLPDELEICCSPIQGMGIFAKQKIPMATNFGMTHFQIGKNLDSNSVRGLSES